MKKARIFIFSLWIIMSSFSNKTEPKTAVEVVQMQLDAYNRQDIQAFSALFSEHVLVYRNLGDSVPSMRGRAEVEKNYGEMFKKYPNNKSTLIGRMQEGDFVIDHEWITGREKEIKIMAIYEVSEGLIVRCWFIRS